MIYSSRELMIMQFAGSCKRCADGWGLILKGYVPLPRYRISVRNLLSGTIFIVRLHIGGIAIAKMGGNGHVGA